MSRWVISLLAVWGLSVCPAYAAVHVAASASRDHVQAAVNAASDGDEVHIPNGSATWSSGISTTKQIIIRAQNYTPTPGGMVGTAATTRNVTITNASSTALFAFTSGNSYHVGIGGMAFVEQSTPADGAVVTFAGSGTKVPLIFDCAFEVGIRNWPKSGIIEFRGRGGVMWNCSVRGVFTDLNAAGEGSILIKWPDGIRNWTTAHTMGTADTSGDVNVYFEDSTFYRVGQCPDIDDHGRFVARHCIFDTAWGLTHGFTSTWGGRHFEYYDNHFKNTLTNANMAGRYFWARAGTGVFTGNQVDNMANPSEYGSADQLNIGDNTSPSSYPQHRQPGGGHSGSGYTVDPIYVWSQTGARGYNWSVQSEWTSMVQSNRDIYVNSGAKPDYAKYTYPHPLRDAIEDPAPDEDPPELVSAVIPSAGTTLVLTWNETAIRTTGTPTLSLSGGAATATYSSGSGSTAITYSLSRTVMSGETGTFSLSGGIEDAAENEIDALSSESITNNSTQTPPSTPRATFSSLTIARPSGPPASLPRSVMVHRMTPLPMHGGSSSSISNLKNHEIPQMVGLVDVVKSFDLGTVNFREECRRLWQGLAEYNATNGTSIRAAAMLGGLSGDVSYHDGVLEELVESSTYGPAQYYVAGLPYLSAYSTNTTKFAEVYTAMATNVGMSIYTEPHKLWRQGFTGTPPSSPAYDAGESTGYRQELVPTLMDHVDHAAYSGFSTWDYLIFMGGANQFNQVNQIQHVTAGAASRSKGVSLGTAWFHKGYPHKGNSAVFESWGYARLVAAWEAIIAYQPDRVELITWNDMSESSYLVDWPASNGTYGQAYVRNHWNVGDNSGITSHKGYREVSAYYAEWYRTLEQPAIPELKVYYEYRPHPRNASAYADLSSEDKTDMTAWLPNSQQANETIKNNIYQRSGQWGNFSDGVHILCMVPAGTTIHAYIEGTKVIDGFAGPGIAQGRVWGSDATTGQTNYGGPDGSTRYTFSSSDVSSMADGPHFEIRGSDDTTVLMSGHGKLGMRPWPYVAWNTLAYPLTHGDTALTDPPNDA
jgi:hypothetical protein